MQSEGPSRGDVHTFSSCFSIIAKSNGTRYILSVPWKYYDFFSIFVGRSGGGHENVYSDFCNQNWFFLTNIDMFDPNFLG